MAADVGDDGALGLVVSLRMKGGPKVVGSVYVSDGLRLSGERAFPDDIAQRGFFGKEAGIAGQVVVTREGHDIVLVSLDGGATFESHVLPARFTTPAGLVCGVAGCDFGSGGWETTVSWRWGDQPLKDTLTFTE
jgi:hypothetical protein